MLAHAKTARELRVHWISRSALYEIGGLLSAKFGRSRRIPRRALSAYAASQLHHFLG
jgi:hypothetical protein